MQNPTDMKPTFPIAAVPDVRGWNAGPAEVSVEFCGWFEQSQKNWQICMWVWNSRMFLKLTELLKQSTRANRIQWSAFKPFTSLLSLNVF